MTDWDDAYENSAYIAGAADYPARWAKQAQDYRARAKNAELDIAYGTHEREKFDLFLPDNPAKGVLIFVHGGYWMKLDKSSWSHFAGGGVAHGWAVAVPGYVLTPAVRISEITRQIAAAVGEIGRRVAGPIALAGHSAGGHLVSRMICNDALLPGEISARIKHVMSISGLHDLRPLLHTKMNDTLGLDKAEARAESAGLQRPVAPAQVTAWVGADERPEFIRQSKLLTTAWANAEFVCEPGHHHFSVVQALADPASAMVRKLLG